MEIMYYVLEGTTHVPLMSHSIAVPTQLLQLQSMDVVVLVREISYPVRNANFLIDVSKYSPGRILVLRNRGMYTNAVPFHCYDFENNVLTIVT